MKQDYEKLGLFYLGRPYDLTQRKSRSGLVLYDSKDLVTHAVCVGMTGSGKTGLCIGLIEEAALDGIPIIAIDPKGDLGNLLLTFPRLSAEDFRPWINEDDARRKDATPEAFAKQEADRWRAGLADWQQDGERIERLRNAADFAIYTPGSNAGLPISILKSFSAPSGAVLEDGELLGDRVATSATSLLTLAGIDAEPVRSREHVLLSTILATAWNAGTDLDLAAIIQQVQKPPISRIGVLDLEAFYPEAERFKLALALNHLLAAPGFDLWLQGDPLDVGRLLHTAEGKPRVSILSIAHLGDAERMSFVSLLLNEVLAWMRGQSGTSSLRAILYMDEIFGYFPPVANPPAKKPLLTLLKQGRAFGLGLVLATQNPVDLDYKGLSNTGTWFLGRLQTDRDKARVLDGLEGAATAGAGRFDRAEVERVLSGLTNRVFLMHNVHEDAPEIFETRWTMSYLRGPLTRDQIKTLMKGRRETPRAASADAATDRPAPVPTATSTAPTAASPRPVTPASGSTAPPVLAPDVPQFFLPTRDSAPAGASLQYEPAVFAAARLEFSDAKWTITERRDESFLAPFTTGALTVDWDATTPVDVRPADLAHGADGRALYGTLPAAAGKAKSYEKWTKDFSKWVYQTRSLDLFRHAGLGMVSKPGESERDFRIRLRERAREERDRATEELRRKYAPKMAVLSERIRKAEQAVSRESEQATQQKVQTALSFGATVLGAMFGRKAVSASTIGRATTTARGVGRAAKESEDVRRASENVEALRAQLAELDDALKVEIAGVAREGDPASEPLETISIKPKRGQVTVQVVALAWTPRWV